MSSVARMPVDVARCEGVILVDEKTVECPQRQKCLRFMSPSPDPTRQVYLFVEGELEVGNCSLFLGLSVATKDGD